MTLSEFTRLNGLEIGHFDDKPFRFDRHGKLTGWTICKEEVVKGKIVQEVLGGDWGTNEFFKWSGGIEELSADELQEYERISRARKEERDVKEAEDQEKAAKECERVWKEEATDRGESPYFKKKGLPGGLYDCKLLPMPNGIVTLVPQRDCQGKLWGLTRISADGSEKRFWPGARVQQTFHIVGAPIEDGKRVYVCEGIATAISIHLSSGTTAVCAFVCGNLKAVAEELRRNFPLCELVIAADNDPKPGNAGLTKGRQAAPLSASEAVQRAVRRLRPS